MRKILTSIFVIALVAGAAYAGTSAFFSDVETSQNNVLAAGDIDLQIDNHAWYNGVLQNQFTWDLRDLTIERFFDYRDLKPGDWEEDTISIHVGSNDAWLCANADITMDNDNGLTEPEAETGDTDDGDGELDEELHFAFWVDDGDNVLEVDEYDGGAGIFLGGPLSNLGNFGTLALADSNGGALGLFEEDNVTPAGVPAGDEFFIGKAFCYGILIPEPVGTDQGTNPGDNPGFTCDGSDVGNESQTDVIVGNLSFYAEQVRNNEEFVCSNELFTEAVDLEVIPSPLPSPTN